MSCDYLRDILKYGLVSQRIPRIQDMFVCRCQTCLIFPVLGDIRALTS